MMRGSLQSLVLAVLTLSCIAGGGGGGGRVAIDQGAAGSTVRLRQGQLLVLSLPGNPATGYRWEQLPGAEPVLTPQEDPHYTPAGDLVGGGGSYRFTFLARQGGRVPLRFVYRRSFEKDQAPAQSFEVTVVVE
ncbi:hypothetical protein GMLC_29650 [Geomonas limicola]|uniref:Proteinase inhibitor I42 chagasin domain-containing protein n=1 Tax=Geomonas limicola TaxID=2740186 RepID=A0A6V8NA15_9BACT|nr:protease inhibitor I42 family protein [Geomonas limicola]GFO69386.1 hypothetical protein GMLC_29650 [Geomonas limicola]